MTSKYSQNFKNLFNFSRIFARLCGCDVINVNYKMHWKTLAIFILMNMALGSLFYSNYVEVIVKGDVYNLLKTTSVVGTGVQGYAKFINVIKQKNNFRFVYNEILDMYETCELKSHAYTKWLAYNLALIKKLLLITFLIALMTSVGVIIVPIYMLIFMNKRVDVLPFAWPFIDGSTDIGFYITLVGHISCVIFGGYGNFANDSWLFIFASHVTLMKNVLKCKFDDLDEILKEFPKDPKKSKEPLDDIFKWHQKYLIFCNTIRDTFFWVIFIQIGFEFLGIICTIVCMFLDIWPPAPVYLIYLYSLLISYCSLGNLVELSNDDVIEMIYNSCWYNLTVSEQKMILIMLRESQKSKGISIGGVAPLSMNTALQITKTVYTMTMMLMESLN
ncbi:odorant receptor 67d-like [Lucilia sericata]|uniref:odorant receptor 67d-like n=1 Tax=Lucilia sericata TaxID=13632 RepID=UPI0018A7F3F2|nr:odorant receptor 67d-like [Lucilia sericata]